MKPERNTRYMSFPKSKVYHKLGTRSITLCGLDTFGRNGQRRLFVIYSFAPIVGKTYCVNCQNNEHFADYVQAPRLRRRDAKVST